MKVVQLNAVCGVGSTGGVTIGISQMLTEHGIENYILYTNGHYDYELGINYSNKFLVKSSAAIAAISGNYGFNSHIATKRLIKILNEIKPDIVHLHNIHGHDLNLKMFFEYLKETGVRVIWTFHDCWAFTGYCMHFDAMECSKWQHICENCPQAKKYSIFTDRCKELYLKKKELFTSIDDLTVVSPSRWLADLTKKSYLNKYPIEVINNGIDLETFKPSESDFREKYNLTDKKIILGVPKGHISYFEELNKIIDHNKYKIVLVGLNSHETESLSDTILGLPRTNNRSEMAKLFTAADVYVNTTLEDTFPTVNLESLACGTPVITFDTGGSPEAIDEKTGIIVEKRNINEIYEAVKKICAGHDRKKDCIDRAHRLYNGKERFNDYFELYSHSGRFQ